MVCNGTKSIFAECTPLEPGSTTGTAYGHREPLARNPCPPGTRVVQWCLPVRKQQVGLDAACNATENGERTPASTVATATIAQNRRIETTNRTTSHARVITRHCPASHPGVSPVTDANAGERYAKPGDLPLDRWRIPMRTAVAIFFVLCAIFLFILSLQAELAKEGFPHHKHTSGHAHLPAHSGHSVK